MMIVSSSSSRHGLFGSLLEPRGQIQTRQEFRDNGQWIFHNTTITITIAITKIKIKFVYLQNARSLVQAQQGLDFTHFFCNVIVRVQRYFLQHFDGPCHFNGKLLPLLLLACMIAVVVVVVVKMLSSVRGTIDASKTASTQEIAQLIDAIIGMSVATIGAKDLQRTTRTRRRS
jgi:hypothetical protein